MKLTNWIRRNSTATFEQLFDFKDGAVKLLDDGQGNISIVYWNTMVVGFPQPSQAQIASVAALPEADPFDVLRGHVEYVLGNVLAAGISVNVAAEGAPEVRVLCDGKTSTIGSLGLLDAWGQRNATASRVWVDNNGSPTLLTGAQLVTLATLVGDWVNNVYAKSAQLYSQIAANALTLVSEVDAVVWPTA